MARISWGSQSLRIVLAAALFLTSLAHGQASMPPQNVEDALHQMSDKAGVIFAGQVVAVRGQTDEDASGVVEIEFRVDQAIRGCTTGTPYLLREWAGLWTGGTQRYRVGQRLLLFLHTPSPSGLSSPINGLDGAIPIHGTRSPLVATSSTNPQYPVADLRWIGTEVLQPISYQAEPAPSGYRVAIQPAIKAADAENADLPLADMAAGSDRSAASIPAQQASVEAVVGMILSWQKAQHAAH